MITIRRQSSTLSSGVLATLILLAFSQQCGMACPGGNCNDSGTCMASKPAPSKTNPFRIPRPKSAAPAADDNRTSAPASQPTNEQHGASGNSSEPDRSGSESSQQRSPNGANADDNLRYQQIEPSPNMNSNQFGGYPYQPLPTGVPQQFQNVNPMPSPSGNQFGARNPYQPYQPGLPAAPQAFPYRPNVFSGTSPSFVGPRPGVTGGFTPGFGGAPALYSMSPNLPGPVLLTQLDSLFSQQRLLEQEAAQLSLDYQAHSNANLAQRYNAHMIAVYDLQRRTVALENAYLNLLRVNMRHLLNEHRFLQARLTWMLAGHSSFNMNEIMSNLDSLDKFLEAYWWNPTSCMHCCYQQFPILHRAATMARTEKLKLQATEAFLKQQVVATAARDTTAGSDESVQGTIVPRTQTTQSEGSVQGTVMPPAGQKVQTTPSNNESVPEPMK